MKSDVGLGFISEPHAGFVFTLTKLTMEWLAQRMMEDSTLKTALKATKGSVGGFRVHFAQVCAACHGDQKSTRREFSDQAWAALVSWGEITRQVVDEPICTDCYVNLREVLIDRSEEILEIAVAGNAATGHAAAHVAVG